MDSSTRVFGAWAGGGLNMAWLSRRGTMPPPQLAPCAVQRTGPRAPKGWPAFDGVNAVWCDRVKSGNGHRDTVALSHLAKPRRRDGRGDGRNLVLVTVQPRA